LRDRESREYRYGYVRRRWLPGGVFFNYQNLNSQ